MYHLLGSGVMENREGGIPVRVFSLGVCFVCLYVCSWA
jgi:hypothetical protein